MSKLVDFKSSSGINAQIHRFDAKSPKGTIIYVQGWNCRIGELEGIAKTARDNGYSGRTFELPGFGKTQLQATSARHYFREAAGIIAEMCYLDRIEKPIIVPHSMGGYVASEFLRLVHETGKTGLMPRALYEITPGKADPLHTLPTDRLVFKATGWATRLLINTTQMTAAKAETAPTERNTRIRDLSLKTMLHAFDVLGPIMIRLIGGSKEAAAEFGNFTSESLKVDPRISAMQVLAMCQHAPTLGGVGLPPHIRQIYGTHDIFIHGDSSIPLALSMYRGVDFSFAILPTGHFPHREAPELVINDLLRFLERV